MQGRIADFVVKDKMVIGHECSGERTRAAAPAHLLAMLARQALQLAWQRQAVKGIPLCSSELSQAPWWKWGLA